MGRDGEEEAMENKLDLLYERRSIREYSDEPVSDEQVEAMLKAAMAAPSAQNLLPWHFVVVRKRKMLDKLAEVHKYAHMLEQAPLAIVVCGDQEASKMHWVEDTCAATQNVGVLCVLAVGHPAEKKKARTQFDAKRAHQEKW
jgi:hypothetical protein